MTFSYFSSPFTTVADALKTGKLHADHERGGAHVDMDNGNNRARGRDLHRPALAPDVPGRGQERDSVRAGAGIDAHPAELLDARVSEGAGEFERRAGALPDGSRGGRGRWRANCRAFDRHAASASGPHRANGIYVIRFRNIANGPQHPRFIRGYGFQGGAQRGFNFGAEGFGADYKKAVMAGTYGDRPGRVRRVAGALGQLTATSIRTLRDAWGIPALRIQMTHGDNEKAMMEDAAAQRAEMLEAAGAKNIKVNRGPGDAGHGDPRGRAPRAWATIRRSRC